MLKSNLLRLGAVMSVAMVLALPGSALAQNPPKKITYEEAFKRCKAFMDKEKGSLGAGTTSDANKATRGASCMKRFGHKL